MEGESERWPNGKPGNRRTGTVKGSHSGKRRGQLPADKDPIILQRRALAAPLWTRGYGAAEIREMINTWLESQGELPASLDTIYKDHSAIIKQWQKDYLSSVEESRARHVASLERVKRTAWEDHDGLKDGSGAAGLLGVVRSTEETLAKLDGSLSADISVSVPLQNNIFVLPEKEPPPDPGE